MSADDNLSHDRLHQARDPPLGKINTEFFALPNLPGLNDFDPGDNNRDSRQMCADDPWCQDEYVANRTTDQLLPTDHHHNHPPDGVDYGISHHLERHSWVVPMLALAAVNVLVLVTFEVYVVCKASRNTPSRRHLFLGQMLLLGLIIGSLVGFAYAMEPTDLSCAVIRFGTGLSYSLIYSSLLVKLVFLISLNTGVYLPATYQALLFFFCLLVQLVIGLQWLSSTDGLCNFTTRDHILSLLYVVFLILFSAALAIKSRHYRDNYREAKYIGGLLALTIPVWLTWIMASVILQESYQWACLGFGLLVSCAITFVVMFLPKSRQLSAIGKEGIYIEDQADMDRFSIHSDRYSPSFYHFKPHKTVLSGHPTANGGSMYKEARPESPYFRAGNSYTGFHRPLRVVPPSATPSNGANSRSHHGTTPTSSSRQNHQPTTPPHHRHHQHHHQHQHPGGGGGGNAGGQMPPHPPPYTIRTSYFPSHFFPEKMHQYWQYYYPRIPGVYSRQDMENIYTSLNEQDRTKSANPNVYFYKANNYHYPGFIY